MDEPGVRGPVVLPSRAELVERFGLADAPRVIQCAMLGHDMPPWTFAADPPGPGWYHRQCGWCELHEVRHPWAM